MVLCVVPSPDLGWCSFFSIFQDAERTMYIVLSASLVVLLVVYSLGPTRVILVAMTLQVWRVGPFPQPLTSKAFE